jgi:hypothetical protein
MQSPESCIYDSIYNARILPGKQNLRRTTDPPKPFAMIPLIPGNYSAGAQAAFGFTLFSQAQEHLPYFLLALKALGGRYDKYESIKYQIPFRQDGRCNSSFSG